MLMIRLQRVGRRNDPSFRVVLTDKRNGPQSGKFLEVLGSYNARYGEPQIKGERVQHWIAQGAQVSDTVYNLLVDAGLMEGRKKNVLPRKSPVVTEGGEEETSASTEATPAEEGESAPAEEPAKAPEEPAAEPPEEKEETLPEEAKSPEKPEESPAEEEEKKE